MSAGELFHCPEDAGLIDQRIALLESLSAIFTPQEDGSWPTGVAPQEVRGRSDEGLVLAGEVTDYESLPGAWRYVGVLALYNLIPSDSPLSFGSSNYYSVVVARNPKFHNHALLNALPDADANFSLDSDMRSLAILARTTFTQELTASLQRACS